MLLVCLEELAVAMRAGTRMDPRIIGSHLLNLAGGELWTSIAERLSVKDTSETSGEKLYRCKYYAGSKLATRQCGRARRAAAFICCESQGHRTQPSSLTKLPWCSL